MNKKDIVRKSYLSEKQLGLVSLDNVDITNDIMLLSAGCGYGKTTLILNWNKDKETYQFYKEINKKRAKKGLAPTTRNRTLILVSRKAIYKQMLHDTGRKLFKTELDVESMVKAQLNSNKWEATYDWAIMNGKNDIISEDIPQITTFASFAKALKNGTFENNYDMIIFDEAHSIVMDLSFAEDNYYILKWLEQDKQTAKLFMTATPDIWLNFVKGDNNIGKQFNFVEINKPLPAKYRADKVEYRYGLSLLFLIKYYKANGSINDNNKCIAFTNSATKAVQTMVEDEEGKTMALISEYSNGKLEITEKYEANIRGWKLAPEDFNYRVQFLEQLKENREVKLTEIMSLNRSRIVKLSKEGLIAEGINLLMATSAYREGISIKDKQLQYVFAEYLDNTNLEQSLNRGRHDELKEIVVILNGQFRDNTMRQIDDMNEFLKQYNAVDNDKEKHALLRERHEQQDKLINGKLERAKIVIAVERKQDNQDITTYEINHYLYAYYMYMRFHHAITTELTPVKFDNDNNGNATIIENYYKYKLTDEKLPTWKEYYTAVLSPYSREGFVHFKNDKDIREKMLNFEVEQTNRSAISELEQAVENFLNMDIDTNMKKELVEQANAAGLVRSNKKQVGWQTVKKAIEGLGYKTSEKRRNNKRYVCITK